MKSDKITPKQEELLQLLRDGWIVSPREYHGRFGTSAAFCRKNGPNGLPLPRPSISQHTIDALKRRGLVKLAGTIHNRIIVLVEGK